MARRGLRLSGPETRVFDKTLGHDTAGLVKLYTHSGGQMVCIVYRLLVPLPVTVEWPSGKQHLRLTESQLPPYAQADLYAGDEATGFYVQRFRSVAHAEHTFRRGLELELPSVVVTFFERLVRDGRAEILHGPHCPLTYLPAPPPNPPWPMLDAFWTFQSTIHRQLGDHSSDG